MVEWAKEETERFDSLKTYNKYKCENNYLGVLGERVLHEWMVSLKIPHVWEQFTKKGWDKPDFIINKNEIDLKTTFAGALMIAVPTYDYYIFSRVNENLKELFVISYIKGKRIQKLIDEDRLEMKKIEDMVYYRIPIAMMRKFEDFFLTMFKEKDYYSKKVRGN